MISFRGLVVVPLFLFQKIIMALRRLQIKIPGKVIPFLPFFLL